VADAFAVAFDAMIKMRVYYSSYHLWAAQHFARLAKELEDQDPARRGFDIAHRAYVTNAILSSAAFLRGSGERAVPRLLAWRRVIPGPAPPGRRSELGDVLGLN
jgi:hypothetical protein